MKNKKTSPSKQSSEPITHLPVLLNIEIPSQGKIPNDGCFIEDTDKNDGFKSVNTVRYGEEVDVDDF